VLETLSGGRSIVEMKGTYRGGDMLYAIVTSEASPDMILEIDRSEFEIQARFDGQKPQDEILAEN
jgi:hypothetical protein